jgi:predicted transposase YdaD
MLQVKDIRETRVYQEAMEEGEMKQATRTIVNMAAKKMPPEEIAAMVEVDLEFVHQLLQGRSNG